MDSTLYDTAMNGNARDDHYIVSELKFVALRNRYDVTPRGNSILHVAALYDQWSYAGLVLKNIPGLLWHQNKKNETALHIAANEGHSEVVSVILGAAGEWNERLMRMKDKNGDTALHKAVRSQHIYVVKLLVRKDPEFEFPANKAGETPLYLAAETGLYVILAEILESCKKPNYAAGPSNRTPLHAAVIQESTDCSRLLWQCNESLCEEADKWGWNPLHYAVKLGLREVVSEMLERKKSLAYLPAGNENDWTTAIHIAASEGDESMIYELLKHCPDCWEMLNSSSQNALHAAALNNQVKLFSSLLKIKHWGSLVDEPDNDGNTPLHLLAASGNDVPEELISHPKVKKMSFNQENQTPHDIIAALSTTETSKWKDKLIHDFGRFGGRDLKVIRNTPKPKDEMETNGNIQQRKEKARRAEIEIKNIMKAAQIQLVVATLIMTVTFTAGFTLPGGFENDPNSPNKGMAILIRNTAFRAFVVADVIAFACSAGSIFVYFFMADKNVDIDLDEASNEMKALRKLYFSAGYLQILAMTAVIVAFITGIYATLAHSLGLAVTACVICCVFFLLYWFIIYLSVTS